MLRVPRSRFEPWRSRVVNAKLLNTEDDSKSYDALKSVGDFVRVLSNSTTISTREINSIIRASMFHANHLNPENTAKFIRFCATNQIADKRMLRRYCEKLIDSSFQGYASSDLAVILNSLCRLSHTPHEVFEVAADHLKTRPVNYSIPERSLGMIYNSFARAKVSDTKLFERLSLVVRDTMPTISPHTAGNICHALGKLRLRTPTAIADIKLVASHSIKTHGSRISPQELSNILYSLANLNISDPDLVEPLIQMIKRKIRKLNSIEVAAICTSLTKLCISDEPLMRQITTLVESNYNHYNLYEMVAVLHAFSQLDVAVPRKLFLEIFPNLLTASTDPIESKTACIAFNAFSRIGIIPPETIHGSLIDGILRERDPQYLINVLFSAGQLYTDNVPHPDLIPTLCDLILESPIINPINCTQIIFALNKLHSTDHDLYSRIINESLQLVSHFELNQIANILYGFGLKRTTPLSAAELELAQGLFLSRKISSTDSSQLVSSVVESAAGLKIVDKGIWETLERVVMVRSPEDPKIDLRTLSAFMNQSVIPQSNVTRIILKRMDVGKLNSSDTLTLLKTLANNRIAFLTDDIVERVRLSVCENIERMKNLNELFGLVNTIQSKPRVPANLYTVTDCDLEGGNFVDLNCRLDEKFAKLSAAERIEYALSALDDLREVGDDDLSQSVKDQLLAVIKTECLGLADLARIVKYLSPQYDKTLARVVKKALIDSGENIHVTRHTLRIATALLRIDSPDLAHLMMEKYLPVWIKAMVGTWPSAVREFVGSCPVTMNERVLAEACKVFQENEVVDLKTWCILGKENRVLPDTDRPYSIDELTEVAMIANRDKIQRRVAGILLGIIPSTVDARVTREEMTQYLSEIYELCRHVDTPGVSCEGPRAILDMLLLEKRLSIAERLIALRVSVMLEQMHLLPALLTDLVSSGSTDLSGSERSDIRNIIQLLQTEYPDWFAENMPAEGIPHSMCPSLYKINR